MSIGREKKNNKKQITSIPANIQIEMELCVGCGICAEVCPFGLPIENQIGRYEISDVMRCTECSACARNCPAGAIFLQEKEGCGCIWCDNTREGDNDCC